VTVGCWEGLNGLLDGGDDGDGNGDCRLMVVDDGLELKKEMNILVLWRFLAQELSFSFWS